MGGSTADVFADPTARLLSGHEANAFVETEFSDFDPDSLAHRSRLGDRLIELGEQLAHIQASGHSMQCSNQIYLEAKWLQHYTTYWNELTRRLEDLATSLHEVDQDFATQQSAEAGLWGACYERSFFKVEATMLALIELETKGQIPRYEVHLPPPFDSFENSFEHFNSLLISDIARTGIDNRGELVNLSTVAALLYFKGQFRGYVREIVGLLAKDENPDTRTLANSATFAKLIDDWQDPVTGYWGAWYASNGHLYKTTDLSVTFHMISYRRGEVHHWPAIIETTFAIENEPYPFGWKHKGGFTNHNNYDIAKIFSYGWPHMTPEQQRRAAAAIDEMVHWTLSESLQTGGSFKTVPTFFSSTAADFYFGVSFLQTVGFWDAKKRFWTDRPFPEALAICERIKAQLIEMGIESHESEVALERLEDSC
jgi:hypothetical protein